jgi:4-methylaminobutanoate oxidase (formaldehyde-forming)
MTDSLPVDARVVVIGGGVMGCSTLYHLAKLGVRDLILLERKKLTCGTTWHSAAQVRQLRSTNNLTQLIRYSTELYASLEEETGQSTGWTRTGSLSIATNADRLKHIRHQASLATVFGVETHELSPAQAAELWPMMRSDDIIGAVYSPDDGRVNPSDLCAALIKGGKARGARVFEDTAVAGFHVHDGRVSGVQTERGDVSCETVVNCAGLWGRQVGAMAGVSVPLYACEHFYLLTKPIEGLGRHLPTLSDHDGYLYIRDDVDGILAGCFEPGAKALSLDKLPAGFAFDLLDEDWDHFEPMMHNAMHRIPALEQAQVKMLVNGPESFTPDGGETPQLKGFFVGCGMNSVGVASGGGAGRALAEWIVAGAPTTDLWSVDIRRFAPFHANETFLRARIPEMLSRARTANGTGTAQEPDSRSTGCGWRPVRHPHGMGTRRLVRRTKRSSTGTPGFRKAGVVRCRRARMPRRAQRCGAVRPKLLCKTRCRRRGCGTHTAKAVRQPCQRDAGDHCVHRHAQQKRRL